MKEPNETWLRKENEINNERKKLTMLKRRKMGNISGKKEEK